MKTEVFATLLLLTTFPCRGQGTTFLYDQQSSTQEFSLAYGSGPTIQSLLPSTGQSFTPALSAIDFIRLKFQDNDPSDGLGATIFLNLRSSSITGPVLGTTPAVSMADGFTGTANFFFPNTIPLTPGTTYYFDLNLQSVGPWNVDFEGFNYRGGVAWAQGRDDPAGDYWFREGLVVPEPSSAALLLLAGAAFVRLRRRNQE